MNNPKIIRSLLANKTLSSAVKVGLGTAVLMVATELLVGMIPINSGLGWDGQTYFEHIMHCVTGEPIRPDTYHEIRMGSFVPAIILASLHVKRFWLLSFQFVINVALLASAAGLFFHSLRKLGASIEVAILSTATLVFSWPFLVMPVFYRLLTDHLALAIACASLWAWVLHKRFILALFCVWSFFVLPGLFIVPLVFSTMPYKPNGIQSKAGNITSFRWVPVVVFCVVGPILTFWLLHTMLSYSNIELTREPHDIPFAQPELRFWSECISCIWAMMICWLWTQSLFSRQIWKNVDRHALGLNVALIVVTVVMIGLTFDWSLPQSKGPDLIHNLYMESLNAPAKPLVAHFLYFGPVIFMAFTTLPFGYNRQPRAPWALLVILIAFLPALAFGSESRQWIEVLPIAVAIFALSKQSMMMRKVVLLFSVALCLPAFGLRHAMHLVDVHKLPIESPEFQSYFGYQGPWMAPYVYIMALTGLIVFLIAATAIALYERKTGAPGGT